MFGMGLPELMVILVIAIVVFGAGRLGSIGSDLGKAIRNFRKELNEPDAIDVTPKNEPKSEEAEKK